MPIKMIIADANPRFPVEVIGNTPQEVWKLASQMANIVSVPKCGNETCKSSNVRPSCREVEGPNGKFDSYEWRCESCGSSLGLGVNKTGGGLFLRWDQEWFKPERKTDVPPI